MCIKLEIPVNGPLFGLFSQHFSVFGPCAICAKLRNITDSIKYILPPGATMGDQEKS